MVLIVGFIIFQMFNSFHSIEINKENCINGKEISSKCSFKIRIKPPLTKLLKCTLKFNDRSNEMRFSIIKFRVKAQEANKCPFVQLIIFASNKPQKLVARSCGCTHDAFNETFSNVSLANISYHNQGLNDQETNVEMILSLSDRKFCDEPLAVVAWDKLHLKWIIAVMLLIISFIIGMVVIMRRKQKGCFKKNDGLLLYVGCESREESTGNQIDQKSKELSPESTEDRITEAEIPANYEGPNSHGMCDEESRGIAIANKLPSQCEVPPFVDWM